jgi:hypothetical protein
MSDVGQVERFTPKRVFEDPVGWLHCTMETLGRTINHLWAAH